MTTTESRMVLKDGCILGVAVHYPMGWLFVPNVSGRATGRVYHDTPEGCVPRWARKLRTETLTHTEWEVRTTPKEDAT